MSALNVVELLRKVPILERLDHEALNAAAQKVHVLYYPPEVEVFPEGAVGTHLYIIASGKVEVIKKSYLGEVKLATLGITDFFGEIAILRDIPRTASIRTLVPCTFLTFSREDFLKIYVTLPAKVKDDIHIIIEKRMQEMNVKVPKIGL